MVMPVVPCCSCEQHCSCSNTCDQSNQHTKCDNALTNKRMKRVISLLIWAIQLTGNAVAMYKTAPPTVAAALPTKLELCIHSKGAFVQMAPPLPCSSSKLAPGCVDVAELF